jgi:hypothetical protein
VAVDTYGNALTYSAGEWGVADPINPGSMAPDFGYRIDDVSCSSTTFCAAGTNSGDILTWDGQIWARAPGAAGVSGLTDGAISCVSAEFCVALKLGRAVTFDGQSWSSAVQVEEPNGGHTSDVSCATTTFCVAVDTDGNAIVYDGQQWTQAPGVLATPFAHASVSCAAATYCVAVGGKQASVFTGSAWSLSSAVPGASTNFSSISCPAAGTCVAIDSTGNAFALADGSWTETSAVDGAGGFTAVSCSSTTFCAAVDSYGGATIQSAAGWSAVTTFDQDTGGLAGVSCSSAQFCAAVDASGNALTFRGGAWSAPLSIDPHVSFRAVSCAAANFCAAIGSTPGINTIDGVLYVFDGQGWQLVPEMPLISSISCPTAQFCRGTDYTGDVIAFDGQSWTATPSGLNNFHGPLACTSPSFCANGYYFWDGASWTFKGGPVASVGEISCASPTFCAMPANFHLYLWDGTSWSDSNPGQYKNFAVDDGLSCPSAALCALTNRLSGSIRPFENGTLANPIVLEPDPSNFAGLQDISCPSTTVCVTVDYIHAGRWSPELETAPVVSTQPINQTAIYGDTATFHATATGTPTPTVQWQRSTDRGSTWANIAGATHDSLTVVAKIAARYRAVFSNPAGQTKTAAADLTVWRAPTITRQPQSQTVQPHHDVTFHADATGTPTPTPHWQVSRDGGKHWATLTGATGLSLTVHATRARSGNKYHAHFTNRVGSTNTRAATLTVIS